MMSRGIRGFDRIVWQIAQNRVKEGKVAGWGVSIMMVKGREEILTGVGLRISCTSECWVVPASWISVFERHRTIVLKPDLDSSLLVTFITESQYNIVTDLKFSKRQPQQIILINNTIPMLLRSC